MHEPAIREGVKKLRKKGYTFREILKEFPFLGKSTISEWTRDIILTSKQEKRILQGVLKNRVKLIEYNKQKHLDSIRRYQEIIFQAKREIGKFTRRDLLIAGTALYWAEGWTKSRNLIDFSNSDPRTITLMMRFFREIFKIKENRFRGQLILHPGLDKEEVLKFWSSLTGIPIRQFHKTQSKLSRGSTGKTHNILYKGTFKIRISDTENLWRIKGFIEGFS